MKKNHKYRAIYIHIPNGQYEKILTAYAQTTCRSLSQYCRTLVMGKPVTVLYRDQSFDEFGRQYIDFKSKIKQLIGKDSLSEEEKQQLQALLSDVKKMVNSIVEQCMQR